MKFLLALLCMFLFAGMPQAQAAMIGEQQEIEMGRKAGEQLEAHYGLYQDEEMQARIDRIGQSLAQYSNRKIPYRFKVLNTQDVNALACPGGFIYVYKGLVDFMTSDDELAAVRDTKSAISKEGIRFTRLKSRWPCPFCPSWPAWPAATPGRPW